MILVLPNQKTNLVVSKSGRFGNHTEPFLEKKNLPQKISGKFFWNPVRFFGAENFFEAKARCD